MQMTQAERLAAAVVKAEANVDLHQWLREQADQGLPLRTVADMLRDLTNGEVDVTYQTVANWTPTREQATS